MLPLTGKGTGSGGWGWSETGVSRGPGRLAQPSAPGEPSQLCSRLAPDGPSAVDQPSWEGGLGCRRPAWPSAGGSSHEGTDALPGRCCPLWLGPGTTAATLNHPHPATKAGPSRTF